MLNFTLAADNTDDRQPLLLLLQRLIGKVVDKGYSPDLARLFKSLGILLLTKLRAVQHEKSLDAAN